MHFLLLGQIAALLERSQNVLHKVHRTWQISCCPSLMQPGQLVIDSITAYILWNIWNGYESRVINKSWCPTPMVGFLFFLGSVVLASLLEYLSSSYIALYGRKVLGSTEYVILRKPWQALQWTQNEQISINIFLDGDSGPLWLRLGQVLFSR